MGHHLLTKVHGAAGSSTSSQRQHSKLTEANRSIIQEQTSTKFFCNPPSFSCDTLTVISPVILLTTPPPQIGSGNFCHGYRKISKKILQLLLKCEQRLISPLQQAANCFLPLLFTLERKQAKSLSFKRAE